MVCFKLWYPVDLPIIWCIYEILLEFIYNLILCKVIIAFLRLTYKSSSAYESSSVFVFFLNESSSVGPLWSLDNWFAFILQASEDAKKLVNQEKSFACAEIESARAVVQRIGEALEEQERNQSSDKQQVALVASAFLYYFVCLITGLGGYMDTTEMSKILYYFSGSVSVIFYWLCVWAIAFPRAFYSINEASPLSLSYFDHKNKLW